MITPSETNGQPGRGLDFLIIGTQKGGTTSLWQYLREHPRLAMPRSKEAAFFSREEARSPGALDAFVGRYFPDAAADALLGKATTRYMIGCPEVHVGDLAERIRVALPRVKLIALLRDPIERAVSGYAMAVRRNQDRRPVDVALEELLTDDRLAEARLRPVPENSYVVLGEYGRILEQYCSRFPSDQMLTLFTEDLAVDPGGVVDDVLSFLGLPTGFRPDGLGVQHFRGGTRKRLDPEGEKLLFDFLGRDVLPYMRGSAEANRKAFILFFATWNVAPEAPPPLPEETRMRLEDHFRSDADVLRQMGVRTPWIDRWNEGRG